MKSVVQHFSTSLDSGLLSRVYPSDMGMVSNHVSMQIGEVAKRPALSVDAIRFYERNSRCFSPRRRAKQLIPNSIDCQ
jgi:hypothetical protein